MAQLNPYLNFNGNTREAMAFYQSVFGGELTMQTVGETPMPCPAGMENQIMHSMLVSGGVLLMGSDMQGPDGHKPGNTVTMSLNCSSEEEITTLFNKLAEGGHIAEPLKEMFWGALFGALADKYGVRWMFNFDKGIGNN
ncbi:MAG: VOC family protein [Sphingobacteriales bacterium JAD_PAG50586_3]|nr:MAG: VOC family protein [Sphingobacteriales bacterium JAD_PAG50586_3]